jgi:hypothetical protein
MSTKDLKPDGKKPAPYTVPVPPPLGDSGNGKKTCPLYTSERIQVVVRLKNPQ